MPISPFLAFTRGAFEGYNLISEEERASKAAENLERYKKSLEPDTTRYFQAMGSNGLVKLFPLADAGDYTEEELLRFDMNTISEQLIPENRIYIDPYGITRNIDDDPVLSNNVDKRVRSYMRAWFDANTIEKGGENNKYTQLPYDWQNEAFFQHPYYGTMFTDIVMNGMYKDLPPPPNNNAVPVVSMDDNKNINGAFATYSNETIGPAYNRTTQQYENMTPDVFNNTLVKKFNKMRGAPSTAANYTAEFGLNAIRLHNAPVMTMDITEQDYLQNTFGFLLGPNEQVTYGHLMHAFVNQRVPDNRMLQIFNNSLRTYNDQVGEAHKISNKDIFKAFQLSSPVRAEHHGASGRIVYDDAASYIQQHFEINLEQLAVRSGAGKSVVETVAYMKNNLADFEEDNGYFPPISKLLSGPLSFLSGISKAPGGADLVSQTMSLFTSVGENLGIRQDSKISDKMTRLAKAAQLETQGLTGDNLGEKAILTAAATAARHEYYKYMLAYQLAVAIQGGTGGRTVSDQDVENMLNAIGDRLFANGRVQVAVLNTIEKFAQDIVDKNQYWSNSKMGIDYAYAADAMDRFMYGGVSVNTEYGTARTEYAGAMLSNEINKVGEEELLPEIAGLRDNILNDALIAKGIIKPDEIISYRRGVDFNLNLEHHMKVNDFLTKDQYGMLVDRHYSGNKQAQQQYKSDRAYENYVKTHKAYNEN